MARLRVLWLIKGLGPGGAERLLMSAASQADHRRFSYEAAYLLTWKETLVAELQDRGVPCHCLGVTDARDLRWALRLRRLLLQRGYDIVHIHSPLVAAVARLVVRCVPASMRPRIVTTEHNVWSSYARGTRLADRLTHRLDDVRLAVSSEVHAGLPASLRAPAQVMLQGILPEELVVAAGDRERIRTQLGVPPAQILAVTVANLRRQKAYPDLLEAARVVLASAADVRFAAVGQGPLEAALRDLHAHLGLGDGFRWLGYRDDVPSVLAAADLFVLASHHEGLPIALLEALNAGLPAVVTAVGSVPDVIRDGVEGLVVPPSRPGLLAEAILRVARDAELRARLARAATSRARSFDMRHTVRQTEDLYLRLAAADGRPGSRLPLGRD